MKDMYEVARKHLWDVCGVGGMEPSAQMIVDACIPIIASSMVLTDSDDATYENNNAATIAKRAFCVGFMCGQNESY